MLYCFQDGLKSNVCAADTVAELEAFVTKINGEALPEGVLSVEQVSFMEMLSNEMYEGFKKAPWVVEFASEEARAAFYATYAVESGKRLRTRSRQEDMLEEVVDNSGIDLKDDRSIAEILGLDEEDPWDRRTDQEKEADENFKKSYEKAKQAGELSGDSFGYGEGKKKGELHVTRINVETDADGKIIIDSVNAVKGFDEDEPFLPEEGDAEALPPITAEEVEKMIDTMEDDEDPSVDPQGRIGVFHRVDIERAKLPEIREVLAKHGRDIEMAIKRVNYSGGCWLACIAKKQSETIEAILTGEGYTVEVYAVSDKGERILAKGLQGVTVVDTNEVVEIGPRPWNHLKHKFEALSDEEREKLWKEELRTDEFIFCGAYEGPQKGCVVYVTPRSYFMDFKKMWDKPLDIKHLLPIDLKEVSPGVYRSHSRDWNHLSYAINQKGFKENLYLQIWLNNE